MQRTYYYVHRASHCEGWEEKVSQILIRYNTFKECKTVGSLVLLNKWDKNKYSALLFKEWIGSGKSILN